MKRTEAFEAWFFMLFGVFHLHRVWGLLDRASYAAFWLGLMAEKGVLYHLLMGVLGALCLWGIRTFWKNRGRNFWWRWIYVLGGGYLLFDLLAIAADWAFWRTLIVNMYDTASPWWTPLWCAFIGMGGASFALGVFLLIERKAVSKNG